MRKALTLAAASTVALLLAGCSSSGKQAQTLAPAASSSSPAAVVSASPAFSLSSELLEVTQLPAGWSATSSSDDSGGATSCSALNNRPWQTLPERAEADFQQSADGPFLAEKLDAGSAAQVSQAWTAFGTATSTCRSFTASGGSAQYTLSALSFPQYGDETYAFALTVTASGESAAGDVVVVRKGNTLVQIITVGVGDGVPISMVEQATSAAVAKVR